MAPADVETREDEERVWQRVYVDSKEAQMRSADERPQPPYRKMDVGSRVRMSRWKAQFDKGYGKCELS